MRPSERVPSGAYAAQLLQLDGFREGQWPVAWCGPRSVRAGPSVFRVRKWLDPLETTVGPVAHPALLLRHLGTQLASHTGSKRSWVANRDLVEFALEHLLRLELVRVKDLTESYAETLTVQVSRSVGVSPYRQVWVTVGGRLRYRLDLVVLWTFRAPRPKEMGPESGLAVEVDSDEFHNNPESFQNDRERQLILDSMAIHWISITPSLVLQQRNLFRVALFGAFKRAGVQPYF